MKVYYEHFYKDYENIEIKGLADKVFGLEKDSIKKKSNEHQADLNPFKFTVPKKYLDFYEHCGRWLREKKKDEKLVAELIRIDKGNKGTRGFLSNSKIHQCFDQIGMILKKKQIGQLTYALHQDLDGAFSFPELVEYLLGKDYWIKMVKLYGL